MAFPTDYQSYSLGAAATVSRALQGFQEANAYCGGDIHIGITHVLCDSIPV
jgi:hypothetical protein